MEHILFTTHLSPPVLGVPAIIGYLGTHLAIRCPSLIKLGEAASSPSTSPSVATPNPPHLAHRCPITIPSSIEAERDGDRVRGGGRGGSNRHLDTCAGAGTSQSIRGEEIKRCSVQARGGASGGHGHGEDREAS
jgi:hypothetical protein